MRVKLGDVATYINGYAFKPSDWSDTGVPIIRIQDLTGNSYQANRYNGEYAKKYEVLPGDVLISWSASLGVYIWAGEKAVLNQHIFKVVFDKCPIEKSFFVHQVQEILSKAGTSAHGATMKHLTKPVFDALPFYLPPLNKQRHIAAVLDKVSDLIAKRRQQLDKLDELVKARFVEMFGDINVNDKGWRMQPLGELCTIVRGGSPRPIEKYLGGDVPWIKIGDATDGESIYLHSTKEHIIREGISKSRMVKAGSLIFANCGVSLGFARIITFDGCIHDGWLAMEDIDTRLDKVFLLQALNQMTEHFRKIAPTGTQPNLNTAIMKVYKQIIPPMELQKDFIAFIEQTDKSKLAIQKGMEKLETLKKALMQEFFGGEKSE
jgi:restriction endonuclease S subunit